MSLTPISNTRSLTNDLKMGLENELSIIQLLDATFEKSFKNTKQLYNNKYHQYDFESEDGVCVELKSRRNCYNAYPTTIIPLHKIINPSKNIEQVFVFQFTDGVYYIRYDKEKFDTYETRNITTYRTGIYDRSKLHYCIPISDLIKM